MTAIASFQSSDLVTIHNGQAITTSVRIAEVFGKRHDDVLKAIGRLECSDEFRARNFAETEETIQAGAVKRKRRHYEITRDGFVFLAMGFTGKKAARFKEAYINAFNTMERALMEADKAETITSSEQQILRELVEKKTAGLGHLRQRAFAEVWSRVHRKFRVSSYKDIPREKLADAIEYVMQMQIECGRVATPSNIPEGPLTSEQLNELREVLNKAFTGWLWRVNDVRHAHNYLRAVFGVTSIAHIPASRFDEAMALAREIAGNSERFTASVNEARKRFLTEVVEAGAPWTPELQRQWRAQFRQSLPPAVNWQEVAQRLNTPAIAATA